MLRPHDFHYLQGTTALSPAHRVNLPFHFLSESLSICTNHSPLHAVINQPASNSMLLEGTHKFFTSFFALRKSHQPINHQQKRKKGERVRDLALKMRVALPAEPTITCNCENPRDNERRQDHDVMCSAESL